jgi:phage tail-like protein
MIPGFYFQLSFNGLDTAFQEVSGINKELRIEEVISGGENRFKYKLPSGVTCQNLVLKRALIASGSALIKWCSSCIDGNLEHPITTQDVSVSLLNASGKPVVVWTFYNAYPIKYYVSDLKSDENKIMLEMIELSYNYFDIRPS